MRGYNHPPIKRDTTMVMKSTYVGCRGCQTTWYEDRWRPKDEIAEINGPRYDYDMCEKCMPKDFHACSTGDCDHQKQTECDEQLLKDYPKQAAKDE